MNGGSAVHIQGDFRVIIEAGAQISLKAGGSFIDISGSGISISGALVTINSGGAAGTGAGCSPAAPSNPDGPKEAVMPPDAKPGKVDQAPEGRSVKEKKVKLGSSKVKKYTHPQAQEFADAAKDGTPLCGTKRMG